MSLVLGYASKKELRSSLLAIRESIGLQHRKRYSEMISAHLVSFLKSRQDIQHLCMYIPIRNEPAWNLSMLNTSPPQLYAPRVCTPTLMKFFAIPRTALQDLSSISPDYLAIPAPACADPSEEDHLVSYILRNYDCSQCVSLLWIIPCVGIIDHYQRIGYGGGYYDRYFRSKIWQKIETQFSQISIMKLGVVYSQCLVDSKKVSPLPVQDVWDVPVDGSITEYGITWYADIQSSL